uniref:AAA domain-containing protein n=1 Tax=Candidatus Kentrum sp. LPFa TaxID=2126335 RepID=A0A450WC90_9GAMM|nr:MAG: AAA domain-containing protein [Candidatus Kentron sp. LPFa]
MTGIEIFPVYTGGRLPEEVDEFPPWTETLDTVEKLSIRGQSRSGTSFGIWRHDVEDALGFLLQLHRCRAETRLYPVKVDPIGSNRYALVYEEIRHKKYLQGNPLRNQLAGRNPPPMRDFFSEAAAQTGHLMLLPDNNSQPESGWGVEVKLVNEESAGDRIVIERLHKTDVIPRFAWLQPTEDAGVFWQLKQQEDACYELMGMQALVAQLGDPVSVAGLRNQWGEVDGKLKGSARTVIPEMLNSWPLFALQGPPGTGKTTVAAEAIRLMLAEEPHQRILISAQSHYALDNLAERVLETLDKHKNKDFEALRIASNRTSAKVDLSVDKYSIDKLTSRRIGDVEEHCKHALKNGGLRDELRNIVQEWRDTVGDCGMELRGRLRRASNLVFCTTGAATGNYLGSITGDPFDWVIIEEAAKAWPTELAMPLTWGNRWTLIGDHKQLPAFGRVDMENVLTELAHVDPEFTDLREHARCRDAYLRVFDLFRHLFKTAEDKETAASESPPAPRRTSRRSRLVEKLTHQFRMRSDIANLVSEVFYEGKLKTDGSTDKRDKPPYIALPPYLSIKKKGKEKSLYWIDTGSPGEGLALEEPSQRWNRGEITVVGNLLKDLAKGLFEEQKSTLVKSNHLAVLSPYLQQVKKLEQALGSDFTGAVHTVDAFQGREADIVIVSMVRCNQHKKQRQQLGFLTRPERINVLFSRARYLLIIVGSFPHFNRKDEVAETDLWSKICDGIDSHGVRRTAGECHLIGDRGPQS